MHYTFDDLKTRYEQLTARLVCDCVFATEMVGGQPATADGLRAFVIHHLGITDAAEIERAVQRISKEEIGERDVRPAEGELQEKQVYGVNVLRRDDQGRPYLGNWMVKANLKQAASRLKIFSDYIGTKGNFAESGRAYAWGASLKDAEAPERIYLELSGATCFKEYAGRVQSPSGPKSIIHHSETVPVGTRFAFEFRFMLGNLKPEDIRDVCAMAMIMGIGSARSLERGKFRIENADITLPAELRISPAEKKRRAKQQPKLDADAIAAKANEPEFRAMSLEPEQKQ